MEALNPVPRRPGRPRRLDLLPFEDRELRLIAKQSFTDVDLRNWEPPAFEPGMEVCRPYRVAISQRQLMSSSALTHPRSLAISPMKARARQAGSAVPSSRLGSAHWTISASNSSVRPLLSSSLSVDRRRPVEDDGQRRRAAGLLWRRRDEEALPVFGHGVDLAHPESPGIARKKSLRPSGVE